MLSHNMGDSSADNENDHGLMVLPPGFRFHPTDEEVISCYLSQKVINTNFTSMAIAEADFNKCEPWDLPKRPKIEEKEWYFFCQRDRKYPTGTRTNRATETGYWKATGKDKEIVEAKGNIVGMKKTLVFYRGRAPSGHKTNWVMHEFRLEGKFSPYSPAHSAKDDWVVCKVFHKEIAVRKDFPSENPWMNTQEPHEMRIGASSSSRIFEPGPTGYPLSTPNMFLFPQNMHQDEVVCFHGCPHIADYLPCQQMPTTLPCNCSPSCYISAGFDGDVWPDRLSVADNGEISPVGRSKNEAGSLHGRSDGDDLGDDQKQLDIMADFDDLWCG